MTNPNPLPPEIVAKWQKEFEQKFSPLFSMREEMCPITRQFVYVSLHTRLVWQGFLMARQSVVIPVPDCVDDDDTHDYPALQYNRGLLDVISAIEAQGYAVSRE